MALKTLRKHQKKLLAILAVLAMIAFSFDVVIQALTPERRRRFQPIARVYGEEVYPTDLERVRQERAIANRFLALAWSVTGQRLQLGMWGSEFFGGLDRDELLEALALQHEADRLGISFTDEMVTDFIYQITGGQLTPKQFQGIVRQLGVSQYTVYAALKRQLRLRLVESLYYGRARQLADYSRVTPLDAWQLFRRINERVRFDAIPVPVREFVSLVESPSEQELRQFYEQHKDRIPVPDSPDPGFRRPPRVRLQYAAIDVDDLVDEMMAKVTEEQIRKYYEENKELYRIDTGEGGATAEGDEEGDKTERPDADEAAPGGAQPEKRPETDSSGSAADRQGDKAEKAPSDSSQTEGARAKKQRSKQEGATRNKGTVKQPGEGDKGRSEPPSKAAGQRAERESGQIGEPDGEPAEKKGKKESGAAPKGADGETDSQTGQVGPVPGAVVLDSGGQRSDGSFLTGRGASLLALRTPQSVTDAGGQERRREAGSAEQAASDAGATQPAGGRSGGAARTDKQGPRADAKAGESKQSAGGQGRPTASVAADRPDVTGDETGRERAGAGQNKDEKGEQGEKAEQASKPASSEGPVQKATGEGSQQADQAEQKEGEAAVKKEQKEEEPKYRPLEEVADSIRRILAEQAAEREAQARLEKLARVVREYVVSEYLPARQKFDLAGGEKEGRAFEPPPFPDLQPIAKELGIRLGDTGQISYLDLDRLGSLAEAREVVGGAPQGPPFEELFIPRPGTGRFSGAELLEVRFLRDLQGTYYAVWIRDRWPEETPPFDEIRSEVEQAYRMVQARTLAKQRADELADELRRAGGDVQKLVAENAGLEVMSAGPMTLWRRSLALFGGGAIEPVEIPGIEYPGDELRQALLDMPINEPGVQPDAPIRTYYVLVVRERAPAKVDDFVPQMALYLQLAQQKRNREWTRRRRNDLWREGVIELLEPDYEDEEEPTFAGL